MLIGEAICDKRGFELIEFEEWVTKDQGCWLKFSKLPPAEPAGDAAANKKAPPKGKGGATDEIKPVFGRAWISFEDLLKPGSTEIT